MGVGNHCHGESVPESRIWNFRFQTGNGHLKGSVRLSPRVTIRWRWNRQKAPFYWQLSCNLKLTGSMAHRAEIKNSGDLGISVMI